MNNISELRKAIKAKYPDLKFKLRTVSFEDLARDSRVFVESDAWGMTRGNNELYQGVKEIASKYNALATW